MRELKNNPLAEKIFEGFAQNAKRRYMYLCNMDTNFVQWSKNAVEYFGLPGEYFEEQGNIWEGLIHPDDRERYRKSIREVFLREVKQYSVDYRVKNKKGEYFLCTCSGVIIDGHGEEPDLLLGDVENHGIMDNVDAITNLYNIREFWNSMEQLHQEECEIIELLIGLNNFSEINSVYGFGFGDAVLKEVGTKLHELIGSNGMLYRMDGVRFSCCFKGKNVEQIQHLYKKIQNELRTNMIVQGNRISIGVSGGMLCFPSSTDIYSVQSGITYALEKSKYEKNGELVLMESGVGESKKKNLEMYTAIRNSILDDFNGYYLYYQPLLNAATEELIGAEALLRWRGEPYGEVPPGKFIPWLENDPYFFELGNWILERAMTQAMELLEKYPDFILNVNTTYTQIGRSDFREAVRNILEKTGFPPQNLCLELTERCRHLDRDYLCQEANYFNSLGIKLAIDDFGTGYSSLDILFDFKVDTLKFDRTFTMDIEYDKVKQSVIRTMSELAQDLDVHICLEGIETREMIDFMKKYPIYSYQGYYFSKPISMEAFKEKYL